MLKARGLFPNRRFYTTDNIQGTWFIDPDIITGIGMPPRAFLLDKVEHEILVKVCSAVKDAIASVQTKQFRRG